jgi:type II secretory pathway pseudopilin PulG
VELAKINLAAPDITAAVATATNQVAKMQATDDAEAALAAARSMEKSATISNEQTIRAAVRNWKTLSAYPGSGVEGSLKLKGAEDGFDPATFKSVLKLSIMGGHIRVDFSKEKCDSVVVYCRLRGTQGWTKLGNDSRSPYYDTAPLANPNVPETREYMGMGVIDDVEIGLPSDIVSIVFGG